MTSDLWDVEHEPPKYDTMKNGTFLGTAIGSNWLSSDKQVCSCYNSADSTVLAKLHCLMSQFLRVCISDVPESNFKLWDSFESLYFDL